MTTVPLVDYLVLGDDPHLVAKQCSECSARFFGRRNACAACGSDAGFADVAIATTGVLKTFTIVSFGGPGIQVPYATGVVDCEGTSVQGNLVNVTPDPDHVRPGMKVRLTTFPIGTDDEGTEAIGFGFEPLESGTGE